MQAARAASNTQTFFFCARSLPSLLSLVFVAIVNRKASPERLMYFTFFGVARPLAANRAVRQARERCEGSRHFRGLHFFLCFVLFLGGQEREFREDEVRLHPLGYFAVIGVDVAYMYVCMCICEGAFGRELLIPFAIKGTAHSVWEMM